ncbi:MAG TPA: hypothetical protein VGR57_06065 [Ktedonobacterales bacterium]|nr:hypothetical protein [Ktedonobacterales bacterium]
MDQVLGWLKAAYNFISGDAIVLGIVALAFLLTAMQEAALPDGAGRNVVAGVIFLALIALSLVTTLGRERNSAKRAHPDD